MIYIFHSLSAVVNAAQHKEVKRCRLDSYQEPAVKDPKGEDKACGRNSYVWYITFNMTNQWPEGETKGFKYT